MFSLLKNGWLTIWLDVIRFEGSHLRHSVMKDRASEGQLWITVENAI